MKQRGGFTIVEIMVVITIIGILAGIAIFSISTWRTRTAQTEVKHELLTAQSAVSVYRTFNNANPATISTTSYKANANVTLTYILRGDGTFCINGQSVAVSTVLMHVETANEVPSASTCS